MKSLRDSLLSWGRCPQTPGIYRLGARMTALGGGRSRPRPFRRLSRRSGCVPAWPYPPLSYFQSGSHQPRRAILLQRTATTPLTDCLTIGVHCRRPAFPAHLVVPVKALACELPHRLGLPLSRLSIAEIRQHVITQGLVAEISGATLWRRLTSDALRPWQHRSWIFPRDPNFAAKSGPILDLYERVWEGAP